VPAVGPYNLCPDIIQSSTAIPDPQDTLSTLESWNRMYNAEPAPGDNYYYVRGLNGASSGKFEGAVSLFWTPAELILFPSLWKHNQLCTASGSETVSVSASPGHIGVAAEPFLLPWPTVSSQSTRSTFASFIAQNTAVAIPTISSWIEMSQFMTQQLNFGSRNAKSFDPLANAGTMLERMGISIPLTLGESGTLQFMLTSAGLVGDTLGLIVDQYTPEQKVVQILPTQITQEEELFGVQATIDPGFTASLAVQYWNTSKQVPARGSTITLSVNYVVPKDQLDAALLMGVIDSRLGQEIARQLGHDVKPQAVAPIGAVTFVAVPSGS
jgi:hypothetical protein